MFPVPKLLPRRAPRLLILLLVLLAVAVARVGLDQVPTPTGADITHMPLHGIKAISFDGNFVLFLSRTNGLYQLQLRDRRHGTTELISQNASGEAGNADTTYGAISSDGNVVVFASQASNLDGPNPNGNLNIFVRNRAQNTTRILTSAGQGAEGDSYRPSISGDGSLVVFESRNPNVTGDANQITLPDPNQPEASTDPNADAPPDNIDPVLVTRNRGHILTADVATGSLTVLTEGFADSANPDISRDGRFVVFNARSDNASPPQIFRVNLASPGTRELISAQNGVPGDRDSFNPTINADGSVVAFETFANNLGPAGSDFKVVAWNGSIQPVSGASGVDKSPAHLASVSDDGRFVGFTAQSVGAGPTAEGPLEASGTRTFVRRLDTGVTALVTRTETEVGNGADVLDSAGRLKELNPEIDARDGETAVSGDGKLIALTSFSTNLGGQVNDHQNVYVAINPLFGATLRFNPDPPFAGVSAGQPFLVTVEALQENGSVDSTFNGPISLTVQSQGNDVSLNGQTTVNAVNGVAQFANLAIAGPNQTGVSLTASAGETSPFEPVVSQPFNLTNGGLGFVPDPPFTAIGSGQTFQVQVEARLPNGQRDTGFAGQISLALNGNTNTLNGVTSATASQGLATFPNLTITGPSTAGLSLTASGGGFPEVQSAPFTLTSGPVSPTGGILGVTTDTSNSLLVFRSNNQTGALTAGPTLNIPGGPTALKPWNTDSTVQPRFLVTSTTGDALNSVGVDRATGNLTLLDSEPVTSLKGPSPFPIDVEIFNDSVAFVVCNGTDEVQAFPLNKPDGTIFPSVQSVDVGSSPFALKYVDVPGTVDFVLVANLGSNDISVLSWDTVGGILTTVLQGGNPTKANLAGTGNPRGITAGPLDAGGTSYGVWVGNTSTANVSAFTFNPVTGQLTDVATTSAAGNGTGSPVFTGLDGFLYVVNNVTNNLNSYTVDLLTADLTHLLPATGLDTQGGTPDQIIEAISLSGNRFLYVGNSSSFDPNTRNVNGWVRNPDGSLTQIGGLPLATPAGASRVGYIPSN